MKRRELAFLLRHPLLQLEGFVLKGRLLFKPPLDRLLRGIFFDSSGDPRAFYPTSFVMPLCVPTDHIYFTFGDRLRNGGWSTDMPDLAPELGAALKRSAVFLSGSTRFLPSPPTLSPVHELSGTWKELVMPLRAKAKPVKPSPSSTSCWTSLT